MHQSYWQSLARLCYQCLFVFFFSRNTVWQIHDNTLNITVMLGSTSHAGWKNSFSVSYCWNWKPEALRVAHSQSPCSVWTSFSLRLYLALYTSYMYLLHRTDFIPVQCISSVFLQVTETYLNVNKTCHIPALAQPCVSPFRGLVCTGSSLWS